MVQDHAKDLPERGDRVSVQFRKGGARRHNLYRTAYQARPGDRRRRKSSGARFGSVEGEDLELFGGVTILLFE